MKYKYDLDQEVIAKKDFEIFNFDDETGELCGVTTVPKGCKGVITSSGFSSVGGFEVSYSITFVDRGIEVDVLVEEDDLEMYMDLK